MSLIYMTTGKVQTFVKYNFLCRNERTHYLLVSQKVSVHFRGVPLHTIISLYRPIKGHMCPKLVSGLKSIVLLSCYSYLICHCGNRIRVNWLCASPLQSFQELCYLP